MNIFVNDDLDIICKRKQTVSVIQNTDIGYNLYVEQNQIEISFCFVG